MTTELQCIIDSYPPCPGAILPYLDAQQKIEAMAERIQELEHKLPFTNERLFDLVRYKRSELYEANLIDEQEYIELVIEGGSHKRKSVSRLEDYDKVRADLAAAHANISQRESAMDNLREELVQANIRADAAHERAERQLAVIDVMREQLATLTQDLAIANEGAQFYNHKAADAVVLRESDRLEFATMKEEIRTILRPHGLDHIEPVGGVQMLAGRLVDTTGKIAAANERIAEFDARNSRLEIRVGEETAGRLNALAERDAANERLRECRRLIEEAPHGSFCRSRDSQEICGNTVEQGCRWIVAKCIRHAPESFNCDCWKSKSLAATKEEGKNAD